MDEAGIRSEARLQALEYLLCNVYAQTFKQTPNPTALAEERANTLRKYLRGFTVPGIDPSLSDMVSAEMTDALERLLQVIAEMTEADTAHE